LKFVDKYQELSFTLVEILIKKIMSKYLKLKILLIISSVFFTTCKKVEPELYGNIKGIVKDVNNQLIIDASVKLNTSPEEMTFTTSSDGSYEFSHLKPNTYQITVSADRYETKNQNVTIIAGDSKTIDFTLNAIKPTIKVSTYSLDFGATLTKLTFDITNSGNGTLGWQIFEDIDWLSCNQTTGTTSRDTDRIEVTVDENFLFSEQPEVKNITVSTSNGGIANISVNIQGKSTPTISTNSYSNVTDTSSLIVGNLASFGNRVNNISEYGFCYSTTNSQPTISDSTIKHEGTTQLGTFENVISGLTSGTTYYVRAFATNSIGTNYGNPLIITTTTINVGLVAYYPLNGNLNDESGSGFHGVNNNAISTTDRKNINGRALFFNGIDAYATIPHPQIGNLINVATISYWFYTVDTIKHTNYIISKGEVPAMNNWKFSCYYNYLDYDLRTNSAYCGDLAYCLLNRWYHIVLVKDINSYSFYINGTYKHKLEITKDISNTQDLYIGGNPYGYFKGKIDDIRIYNRALSETEITQLYKQ
jgi:hypothetical protein